MKTKQATSYDSGFKTLFDIATDGIFIEDIYGNIINCNQAGETMFGYNKGELIGVNIKKLVTPEFAKTLPPIIEECHITGNAYHERVNMRKDGSTFETEICTKFAMIDGEKRIIAYIHDISNQKKIYKELLETKKELEKIITVRDKFFTILSHDLKSPIHSILGLSEVLEDEAYQFPQKIKQIIEHIKISANMGYDLVNNLLQWSRQQTNQIQINKEKFILGSVCKKHIDMLQNIAAKKQISVTKEFPKNLVINTDKNILLFIIRNLVSNAVKFTKTNGTIHIRVVSQKNTVLFSISDNGIGMTADQIQKVLDKYNIYSTCGTNMERGTGLGIKICCDFLELLGSQLQIESTPNKGSIFYFELPCIESN